MPRSASSIITIPVGAFEEARYIINTEARPKERNTSMVMKNKRWTFQPEKTRFFEKTVVANAIAAQHSFPMPLEGALAMRLNIRFAQNRHGDFDNLEKALCDGMQKIAFKNDKQIKECHTTLFFDKNLPPTIEVMLAPWRRRTWDERYMTVYPEHLYDPVADPNTDLDGCSRCHGRMVVDF